MKGKRLCVQMGVMAMGSPNPTSCLYTITKAIIELCIISRSQVHMTVIDNMKAYILEELI